MVRYLVSDPSYPANSLANIRRFTNTVNRCFWCGNKKTNPLGMCEACHRFPPTTKERK